MPKTLERLEELAEIIAAEVGYCFYTLDEDADFTLTTSYEAADAHRQEAGCDVFIVGEYPGEPVQQESNVIHIGLRDS